MTQSQSITDLATALCLAQAEMGGAIKDSNNPFFKSSYADLTSVIKVIKEPFAKYGLSFVQLPVTSSWWQWHWCIYYATCTNLVNGCKVNTYYQWISVTPLRRQVQPLLTQGVMLCNHLTLAFHSVDEDSELAMYRNEDKVADLDMTLEGMSEPVPVAPANACEQEANARLNGVSH